MGPSIAECTARGSAVADRLRDALEDILVTLGDLNHELNGPIPSGAVDVAHQIPRDIVYAVTEIVRMLRSPDANADQLRNARDEAAWSVETAWSAVLAGDIDDLRQHVDDERTARQR
jgi:hypothetical protein